MRKALLPLVTLLSLVSPASAQPLAPEPNPPEEPRAIYYPQAGDKAYLFSQTFDLDSYPNSVPALEPLPDTFRDFLAFSESESHDSLMGMITSQRLVLLKPATRIEVVRPLPDVNDGKHLYAVEFRPLEGPLKGKTAWVPFPWISKDLPKIDGMSYVRYMELRATREKRQAMKDRMRDRADGERSVVAAWEAQRAAQAEAQRRREAAIIRANTPDWMAVTRDKNGLISSIYTHMPNGSSSFRTSEGYVSDTKVYTNP